MHASIENINNTEVLSEVTFSNDENHYQQCLTNNNNDIRRNNDAYDDDNENDDHVFHNPAIKIINEAYNDTNDDKKLKNLKYSYMGCII